MHESENTSWLQENIVFFEAYENLPYIRNRLKIKISVWWTLNGNREGII